MCSRDTAPSSCRWVACSCSRSIRGVSRTPSLATVAPPRSVAGRRGPPRHLLGVGGTQSGGPEPTRERNMSLLVVEIVLALVALQRGWRTAPLLLVALPGAALAFGSPAASLLAPWVGPYFEPAGIAKALAHG